MLAEPMLHMKAEIARINAKQGKTRVRFFRTRARLSKKWPCHFFEKRCGPLRALAVRHRRTARTLADRAVFSPTYMPPEKMNFMFFASADANSVRLF